VRTASRRALTCPGNALCLATNSLKKHAETKLKPSCSPSNLHLCDDAKKAEVLVSAECPVCMSVCVQSPQSPLVSVRAHVVRCKLAAAAEETE